MTTRKQIPSAVWIQRLYIEMFGLNKYSRSSRDGYTPCKWTVPREVEPSKSILE